MKSTIETEPRGLLFDFDNPRADQVDIADIVRALSNSCRFGGLSRHFYSVAEHARLVHRLVKEAGNPPEICYAALHHDSHEAYLGDVVTPLKKILGRDWVLLQHKVDVAIAEKLRIDWRLFHSPVVKDADAHALRIEAAVLKTSHGVGPQWGGHVKPAVVPKGAVSCDMPPLAAVLFRRAHQAYQS